MDDEINNPNLYSSANVTQPANAPVVAPFSTFYKSIELEELKELHEKRLKEKMDIDSQNRDKEEQLEACPVCLVEMLELDNYDKDSDMGVVRLTRCPHLFHRRCLVVSRCRCYFKSCVLLQAWFTNKTQCPICNMWYLPPNGIQPTNGTMQVDTVRGRIQGFPSRAHIRIEFRFPHGIQTVII